MAGTSIGAPMIAAKASPLFTPTGATAPGDREHEVVRVDGE